MEGENTELISKDKGDGNWNKNNTNYLELEESLWLKTTCPQHRNTMVPAYLVIVNITSALIQPVWHCFKEYRYSWYLLGVSLHNKKV